MKKFRKLYWFRRPDGKVFEFTERDAWGPFAQYEPKWKLMGVSDGTLYLQMTKDARQKLRVLVAQRTQYMNSGKNLPAKLENDIVKANNEFNRVNLQARQAEYARAKGHFERPPKNTRIVTGDPEKVEEYLSGSVRTRIATE